MTTPVDLVLLTAVYPFGNKSETFLESEIGVLAKRFRHVFVLPSHREPGVRALPANVELVEMDWLDEPGRVARALSLASSEAVGVLARTLARPTNRRPYASSAHMYLDLLARNVLKARELRRFVHTRGLSRAIFYDYWFENSTLALALLRREGTVATAVCRAHGFDVYDERWGGRPVPFREAKAEALDAIFVVSDFGARYLKERLPAWHEKVAVAHLGVCPAPGPPPPSTGDVPLVVSCGSLIPSKRVDLIPAVLALLDRRVRWVHFGDGPERGKVEAAAETLPDDVSWDLRGHVDNAEVLRFYRDHHVDAMISLSTSEGLPVSMMEAMSFGIPVVAIGVHGVPEIVNDATGVLLAPDAGIDEMTAGVVLALERGRFDAERIRAFFREHYEAGSNYDRFADALIALREDQTPSA